MVKSKEDTISEFNEQVNMTVEELEAWLENPMSKKAGTGVGLESAAKIIEILKKNPKKDPSKYEDEDLEHMRKVVGYNKRHLAQEEHLNETKTTEQLEKTKSTISLKNWGHDPLKTLANEDEAPSEGTTDVVEQQDKRPESDGDSPEHLPEKKDAGSKRKHDEVVTVADLKNQPNEEEWDVEEADAEGEEADELEEDADGDERARKKSKTSGEEAATEEATQNLLM